MTFSEHAKLMSLQTPTPVCDLVMTSKRSISHIV
ncbi:MAG: hypothetical protein H6Q30_744 [Bacteroidetes bacterium]|nr:hypothetical protein [Bacteroidota bacterium]